MKENYKRSQKTVFFTQWSRKSYAVMASLGSYIQISRLSVDICKQATLKLGGFLLLNLVELITDDYDIENDDLLEEILCESEFTIEGVSLRDNFYLVNNNNIYKRLCFALG